MKRRIIYENLSKEWQNNNLIWVYSDPHFNDSDCKVMDPNWISAEEQISRINKKVGKKDMLIILGDIGDIECVKKLNGYKVLITGNHDKGHTTYNKKTATISLKEFGNVTGNILVAAIKEKYPWANRVIYNKQYDCASIDNGLFDEVYDGPLFINPTTVLSHEKIYLPFGLNIHGHDHSGNVIENEDGIWARINVCSNLNGFEPQRLDDLISRFSCKGIHDLAIERAKERKAEKETSQQPKDPNGHRCCFTGHRPEKMSLDENLVKAKLTYMINEAVRRGYVTFITGMARGVDLWAAEIVLEIRATNPSIHLIVASPYPGFEKAWSKEWQDKYNSILKAADTVRYISKEYSPDCFMKRNMWMVDHSGLVIGIWEGVDGGTKNTIEYARKKDIAIAYANECGDIMWKGFLL